MCTMNYSACLFNAGAGIIGFMGSGHMISTLYHCIAIKPTWYGPLNDATLAILQNERLGIDWKNTNFWKAYLGFNLSHSLGAMMFSVYSIYLFNKTNLFKQQQRKNVMYGVTIGFAMSFLLISTKYWFYIPTTGAAISTSCFIGAYLLSK